jgi:hypothetical protein
MHQRPFFRNFSFGEQKHKKTKVKFLKCSVWEAQSKGISYTSLGDTVSVHTASKITRLV